MDDVKKIAEGLTEAQRSVLRGEYVEITPEECDGLVDAGLTGPPQRVGTYGPVVDPLLPLGLAVRSHLTKED